MGIEYYPMIIINPNVQLRSNSVGSEVVSDVRQLLGVVMQVAEHRDQAFKLVVGAPLQVVLRPTLVAEWVPSYVFGAHMGRS